MSEPLEGREDADREALATISASHRQFRNGAIAFALLAAPVIAIFAAKWIVDPADRLDDRIEPFLALGWCQSIVFATTRLSLGTSSPVRRMLWTPAIAMALYAAGTSPHEPHQVVVHAIIMTLGALIAAVASSILRASGERDLRFDAGGRVLSPRPLRVWELAAALAAFGVAAAVVRQSVGAAGPYLNLSELSGVIEEPRLFWIVGTVAVADLAASFAVRRLIRSHRRTTGSVAAGIAALLVAAGVSLFLIAMVFDAAPRNMQIWAASAIVGAAFGLPIYQEAMLRWAGYRATNVGPIFFRLS
jgi:hypothetical protein